MHGSINRYAVCVISYLLPDDLKADALCAVPTAEVNKVATGTGVAVYMRFTGLCLFASVWSRMPSYPGAWVFFHYYTHPAFILHG